MTNDKITLQGVLVWTARRARGCTRRNRRRIECGSCVRPHMGAHCRWPSFVPHRSCKSIPRCAEGVRIEMRRLGCLRDLTKAATSRTVASTLGVALPAVSARRPFPNTRPPQRQRQRPLDSSGAPIGAADHSVAARHPRAWCREQGVRLPDRQPSPPRTFRMLSRGPAAQPEAPPTACPTCSS